MLVTLLACVSGSMLVDRPGNEFNFRPGLRAYLRIHLQEDVQLAALSQLTALTGLSIRVATESSVHSLSSLLQLRELIIRSMSPCMPVALVPLTALTQLKRLIVDPVEGLDSRHGDCLSLWDQVSTLQGALLSTDWAPAGVITSCTHSLNAQLVGTLLHFAACGLWSNVQASCNSWCYNRDKQRPSFQPNAAFSCGRCFCRAQYDGHRLFVVQNSAISTQ